MLVSNLDLQILELVTHISYLYLIIKAIRLLYYVHPAFTILPSHQIAYYTRIPPYRFVPNISPLPDRSVSAFSPARRPLPRPRSLAFCFPGTAVRRPLWNRRSPHIPRPPRASLPFPTAPPTMLFPGQSRCPYHGSPPRSFGEVTRDTPTTGTHRAAPGSTLRAQPPERWPRGWIGEEGCPEQQPPPSTLAVTCSGIGEVVSTGPRLRLLLKESDPSRPDLSSLSLISICSTTRGTNSHRLLTPTNRSFTSDSSSWFRCAWVDFWGLSHVIWMYRYDCTDVLISSDI